MAEYIERALAIYALVDSDIEGINLEKAVNAICSVPAADVQPVVRGKWIEKPYLFGTSRFCSICGSNYGMPHEIYNFCPNCGADMRKEAGDAGQDD